MPGALPRTLELGQKGKDQGKRRTICCQTHFRAAIGSKSVCQRHPRIGVAWGGIWRRQEKGVQGGSSLSLPLPLFSDFFFFPPLSEPLYQHQPTPLSSLTESIHIFICRDREVVAIDNPFPFLLKCAKNDGSRSWNRMVWGLLGYKAQTDCIVGCIALKAVLQMNSTFCKLTWVIVLCS